MLTLSNTILGNNKFMENNIKEKELAQGLCKKITSVISEHKDLDTPVVITSLISVLMATICAYKDSAIIFESIMKSLPRAFTVTKAGIEKMLGKEEND